MSAIVSESYKVHGTALNAAGNYTGVEVEYVVFQADDEDDALLAVKDVAPTSYENLPLDSISIGEKCNSTTFKVVVNYQTSRGGGSSDSLVESTDATMSFDCGTGTKHMNVSYYQTVNYPEGSDWRCSPNKLIEWNGKVGKDSEVKGVDVPTAQLRETYTKVVKMSYITTTFKRAMANLVGCVNNNTFKGWNAGEVMFLGCSYNAPLNASSSTKVVLTYNFAIQLNETSTIGDIEITKAGWEYAWVIQQTQAPTTAQSGPKIDVKAVVVDRVALMKDFSVFDL